MPVHSDHGNNQQTVEEQDGQLLPLALRFSKMKYNSSGAMVASPPLSIQLRNLPFDKAALGEEVPWRNCANSRNITRIKAN